MAVPELSAARVPWVSVEQMVEVDRVMVDELGITLAQMMENAGRNLAVLARHHLGGRASERRVRVLAGTGGNGGGGLAAARHLVVAGADVAVTLPRQPPAGSVIADQLAILRRLDVPVEVGVAPDDGEPDLVVDALLGYGQAGAPRGVFGTLVNATERYPVLALDIPSGLEAATGQVHDPGVRAAATMTLAAPKKGLDAHPARVGTLYLADISVPSRVLAATTGVAVPSPFARGPLVRLVS